MAKLAEPPKDVATSWLQNVGRFLGLFASDDCWCDFEPGQCPACTAQDLLNRAPVEAWHAAVACDYSTGRAIETVAVTAGVL